MRWLIKNIIKPFLRKQFQIKITKWNLKIKYTIIRYFINLTFVLLNNIFKRWVKLYDKFQRIKCNDNQVFLIKYKPHKLITD